MKLSKDAMTQHTCTPVHIKFRQNKVKLRSKSVQQHHLHPNHQTMQSWAYPISKTQVVLCVYACVCLSVCLSVSVCVWRLVCATAIITITCTITTTHDRHNLHHHRHHHHHYRHHHHHLDLEKFPLVAEANQHAHETVLEPGEALYLPKKYWHHCRTLTLNMCVNFWWL